MCIFIYMDFMADILSQFLLLTWKVNITIFGIFWIYLICTAYCNHIWKSWFILSLKYGTKCYWLHNDYYLLLIKLCENHIYHFIKCWFLIVTCLVYGQTFTCCKSYVNRCNCLCRYSNHLFAIKFIHWMCNVSSRNDLICFRLVVYNYVIHYLFIKIRLI